MIKFIFNYLKKLWKAYIIILFTLLITIVGNLIFPKVLQLSIDKLVDKTLTSNFSFKLLAAMFLLAIGTFISSIIWQYLLWYKAAIIDTELLKSLFSKIISMKAAFYDKFSAGELLTRCTQDLDNISNFYGYGFYLIMDTIFSAILFIPVMFYISIPLSAILFIPLLFLSVIVYFINKKYDDLLEKNRDSLSDMTTEVLELIDGIRISKIFNDNSYLQDSFFQKTYQINEAKNNITFFSFLETRIFNTITNLSNISFIALSAYYIYLDKISLGNFLLLSFYAELIKNSITAVMEIYFYYKTASVSFDKEMEILEEDDKMPLFGSKVLDKFRNFEFVDYSFAYHDEPEKNILQNLNLKIEAGRTIGIVGKTASGKSTLIKQFLCQYPYGRGKLLVNFEELTSFSEESFLNNIAYVPQDYMIFSDTIKNNILMGIPDSQKDKASLTWQKVLQLAQFTDDVNAFPDKEETLLGERGINISGGQKQRLALARAFIKDAPILLLDDALSAVDSLTERKIIENIKNFRQGKTNIIVSHRLSAVMNADKIIVLEDGRIMEEDTPENLLQKDGWFRQQYEIQELTE